MACAALFLASCGSGSNSGNSNQDTSSAAATTPQPAATPSGPGANIPGIAGVAESDTINLTANDQMKYDQTLFKVKSGQQITLTLKNVGTLPAKTMSHDAVILQPGTNIDTMGIAVVKSNGIDNLPADLKSKIIAQTKMLGPGKQDKINFTLPTPGVYEFMCTFPGHYASMNGKIVAE